MTNPLESRSLDELRSRTSIKWRFFAADVLPLWVAEMDVVPAEPIQQAVAAAMHSGDTGYPTTFGYAEAIAQFSSTRWGFDDLAPGRSAVVSDVMMGIVDLLRIVTDPGDSVIVPCPVYPPFYAYSIYADRRVIEAPLTDDGRLDPDAIEAACRRAVEGGKRAALLLANPQNPTGTVHTRAELEDVAAVAARHGVRVISDEIHAPLVYAPADYTPYVAVDTRGLSLHSASKGWNLAGLRSAVIFAGADAGDVVQALPEVVSHGPNHLAVLAHIAAFADSVDWLDGLLVGLDANRRALAALLAEHAPTIRYRIPDATFLAWLDCRETSIADPNAVADPGDVGLRSGPARVFETVARVGLNSGESFGTGGENRVRLNFATRPDVLAEAVRRMGTAL